MGCGSVVNVLRLYPMTNETINETNGVIDPTAKLRFIAKQTSSANKKGPRTGLVVNLGTSWSIGVPVSFRFITTDGP